MSIRYISSFVFLAILLFSLSACPPSDKESEGDAAKEAADKAVETVNDASNSVNDAMDSATQ